MSLVFKLKLREPEGAHQRVTVFVGPDEDHLAHAGVLTFREAEASEFANMLDSIPEGSTETPRFVIEHPPVRIPQLNLPEPEWGDEDL